MRPYTQDTPANRRALIAGAIAALTGLKVIYGADRTERTVYSKIEAQERARWSAGDHASGTAPSAPEALRTTPEA